MTKAQLKVLTAIYKFTKVNNYHPAYDEIVVECSLRSLATIHKHIFNLRRDGYLQSAPHNRARAIMLTESGIDAAIGTTLINCSDERNLRAALIEIAEGLTTDVTSKHVARVALGWEN